MRRLQVLCAVILSGATSATIACKPELAGSNSVLSESGKYVLAYRTQPEKIVIGKHFTIELAVCAKDGTAMPDSVRVDARMPEHRHGMNYKTTVTATGAGRYRAEGLMFHMPGRWEYLFDVRAVDATERLVSSIVIQ